MRRIQTKDNAPEAVEPRETRSDGRAIRLLSNGRVAVTEDEPRAPMPPRRVRRGLLAADEDVTPTDLSGCDEALAAIRAAVRCGR
jgi:hypothetical protein